MVAKSKSSFTTTSLVNQRVLVEGSDARGNFGSVIVDGAQWAQIHERKTFDAATEEFGAAVEKFFAPLMEAAEAAERKFDVPEDTVDILVLQEGEAGVEAVPTEVVKLTTDSIILRLIEEGGKNADRLIWVDEHTLDVLGV